jgi:predicted anti-sigma-YlaC factor YlaD
MLTPVPPNDCARARESASARLDGELVELQGAQLEAHLRSCPDCRAYASGIGALTLELRAAPLVQPATPGFLIQRRRRFGVIPAVAAAAVIAVVAGSFAVGDLLGRQGSLGSQHVATETAAFPSTVDALVLPDLSMPETGTVRATARFVAV